MFFSARAVVPKPDFDWRYSWSGGVVEGSSKGDAALRDLINTKLRNCEKTISRELNRSMWGGVLG